MPARKTSFSSLEPSQRQLRAGELVRHALVDVLSRAELRDPDLQDVVITIGEVRCSPDLRRATVFCSPLGETDTDRVESVAAGLNRASRFLRGRLGQNIELKFTPNLHFVPDLSYDEGSSMEALLRSDAVKRDLDSAD
ncbi:MAG: 30S ribosome-binding factor RbfA [Pseudomonadota bacterium]